MDNHIFLRCIACRKNASFLCQRCSDAYCSPQCQTIHWPVHRIVCFPMPNLVSAANLMLTLHDPRPIHGYKAIMNLPMIDCPIPKAKTNRNFRSVHQLQSQTLYDCASECTDVQGASGQKQDCSSVDSFETATQQSKVRLPKIAVKNTQPSGLSEAKPSKNVFPSIEAYRSTLHPRKLELKIQPQDTPENDLEKWQIKIKVNANAVIVVVVKWFVESPTTSCWVVQQKDVDEIAKTLKEMNRLHQHLKAVRAEEVKINEIYCVQLDDACHRGVVVYRINSHEILVRLIDTGRIFQTRITTLKPLNHALRRLNPFAMEIQFETSRKITIDEVCRVEKVSENSDGIWNVRFVEMEKKEKIFTQADIECQPLPVDGPVELFCLDYSHLNHGYISACKHDPKKINSTDALSQSILEYCKGMTDVKAYCPQLDELCLAYIDDEGQWYRGECVKQVDSNTFMVILIDYGNVYSVKSKNIRKMVEQFMGPTIMQLCAIEGFPVEPTEKLLAKTITYFDKNPVFLAERVEIHDEMTIITIREVRQIIEKIELH